MSRIIMLIPTGTSVGLTSVSLGVIRAMERKGVRLSVFKPIAQPRAGGDAPDQTTSIVRANSSLPAAEPLKMSHVESLLSSNQKDVLMEEIVANYHANTKDAEVVLVEGLVPTRKHQFAQSLNYEIAKTLNAEIVFVMSQGTDTQEQLNERIELTRNSFGGAKNTNITGVMIPISVIQICITALLGIFGVAAALNGYLFKPMNPLFRLLMVAGGLGMLIPGTVTDLAGLLLVGAIVARNPIPLLC